jgi:hypothetical protein
MNQINDFFKSKTSFAVMQYFEMLKSSKGQTNKVYELIYVNSKKKLAYKMLNELEIETLKSNLNKFKLVINDKDGRVWDYCDFKKHQEQNVIVEPPPLIYSKKEIEEYLEGLEDKDRKKWSAIIFIDKKINERTKRFKECLEYFKKNKKK